MRFAKYTALASIIALAIVLPFDQSSSAHAQTIVRPLSRSGTAVIDVPAGYRARDIYTYIVVGGRVSQTVEASLEAPAGAILQAEAQPVSARAAFARIAASGSGWTAMKFITSSNSEATYLQPLSGSGTNGPIVAPGTPVVSGGGCGGLSGEEVARIVSEANAAGIPLTAAQLCAMQQGGGVSTPTPLAASAVAYRSTSGRMVLRKNTCGSASTRTLLRVRVNLSRVSAEARAAGYQVRVKVALNSYRGRTAAALKPLGEGRYKQPLFLMTSLNGWGKQKVTVAEWKGNKIARLRATSTADFVYHRGQLLTRTPAGKFMSGNKATVEVSNGAQMYSVCFALKKQRQNVNGYKF